MQKEGSHVFYAFMPAGHCKFPFHFSFRKAVDDAGFELRFAFPSVHDNLLRVVFAVKCKSSVVSVRSYPGKLGKELATHFRWKEDKPASFITVVPLKEDEKLVCITLAHAGFYRLRSPFDPYTNPMDVGTPLACFVTGAMAFRSFKRQAFHEVSTLDEPAQSDLKRLLSSRGIQLRPPHKHALAWASRQRYTRAVSCLFQSRQACIQELRQRIQKLCCQPEFSATISAEFHTLDFSNSLVHMALTSTRKPFEMGHIFNSIKEATLSNLFATLISCVPLDANPKHPLVQAIVASKGTEPTSLLRELFPHQFVQTVPAPTSPGNTPPQSPRQASGGFRPITPPLADLARMPISPSGAAPSSPSGVAPSSPAIPMLVSPSGAAPSSPTGYQEGPSYMPDSPSGAVWSAGDVEPDSPSGAAPVWSAGDVEPDSPSVVHSPRPATTPTGYDKVLDRLFDEILTDLNARYTSETPEMKAEIDELRLRTPDWLKAEFFVHTHEALTSGKSVMRDAATTAYFMSTDPMFEFAIVLSRASDTIGRMLYTGKVYIRDLLEDLHQAKEMVQGIICISRTLQTLPRNTLDRFKDDEAKKRFSDGEGSARPTKVQRPATPDLPRLMALLSDPNPLKDAYTSLMKIHTTLIRMEPENPPYIDWDQAISNLQTIRVSMQGCIDSVTTVSQMYPA